MARPWPQPMKAAERWQVCGFLTALCEPVCICHLMAGHQFGPRNSGGRPRLSQPSQQSSFRIWNVLLGARPSPKIKLKLQRPFYLLALIKIQNPTNVAEVMRNALWGFVSDWFHSSRLARLSAGSGFRIPHSGFLGSWFNHRPRLAASNRSVSQSYSPCVSPSPSPSLPFLLVFCFAFRFA